MSFPRLRPRRLRKNLYLRDLVAETRLSPRDFIYPIFVKEGIDKPEEISAMPGQMRWPVGEELVKHVQEALDLGVRSVLLFGVPKHKDDLGSSAYDDQGVVQRAVRLLKKELGDEVVVFTDVCLCHYTSHGHCGVLAKRCRGDLCEYVVDNDKTLELLAKVALSHAKAGADVVAPSSMMDGMVLAIREALDKEGFTDVAIMSYAAKYASAFYGPFREAASNAPQHGDRRTYQMDPRNGEEALKEVMLDVKEGADILMVKPALSYLDVIRRVREAFPHYPLAAYNVSGEYSMVKAAAEKGLVDEKKITLEILHSIKRAGANIIITYHALEASRWLKEGLDLKMF
ncbi:porphobilinogen synthase [Ignicoccus hospitalis]|uniref:Delta-aminolevulinic acid dehydratase n=1 Tax=Ignicoccus hospitalis (strain KIN4/I / DSM 18386 / JCM 14125) TaxID=453591 RepID=A8A9A5_IGNH4|nr:porphobilinogen synthase [Ignicoccus hospitalis]ABU81507.1 porphobilinogen synthase [Ignicoccus hospitalis KIN4/I]HIH90442.1 porphobilinogen synthase [Desulfurococcaceae archaeon]